MKKKKNEQSLNSIFFILLFILTFFKLMNNASLKKFNFNSLIAENSISNISNSIGNKNSSNLSQLTNYISSFVESETSTILEEIKDSIYIGNKKFKIKNIINTKESNTNIDKSFSSLNNNNKENKDSRNNKNNFKPNNKASTQVINNLSHRKDSVNNNFTNNAPFTTDINLVDKSKEIDINKNYNSIVLDSHNIIKEAKDNKNLIHKNTIDKYSKSKAIINKSNDNIEMSVLHDINSLISNIVETKIEKIINEDIKNISLLSNLSNNNNITNPNNSFIKNHMKNSNINNNTIINSTIPITPQIPIQSTKIIFLKKQNSQMPFIIEDSTSSKNINITEKIESFYRRSSSTPSETITTLSPLKTEKELLESFKDTNTHSRDSKQKQNFDLQLISSITVAEEMQTNKDQRNIKKYLYWWDIVFIFLSLFAFFSMKITHNYNKFPACLLERFFLIFILIFTCKMLLIISENSNFIFQRFLLVTICLSCSYIKIINCLFFYYTNKMYTINMSITTNITNTTNIRNDIENSSNNRNIKKLISYSNNRFRNIIFILLIMVIVLCFYFTFYFKLRIKSCFSGVCFNKLESNLFFIVFPEIINCVVLGSLIIYLVINYFFIVEKDNSRTKSFSHTTIKMLLFQSLLLIVDFVYSYIFYIRRVSYHDYRVEDYFSFIDLKHHLIFSIYFMFCTLNSNVFMTWKNVVYLSKENDDFLDESVVDKAEEVFLSKSYYYKYYCNKDRISNNK